MILKDQVELFLRSRLTILKLQLFASKVKILVEMDASKFSDFYLIKLEEVNMYQWKFLSLDSLLSEIVLQQSNSMLIYKKRQGVKQLKDI